LSIDVVERVDNCQKY